LSLLSSQYRLLSTAPGIYLFLDKRGKILYVGKAKNLKKRVSSYFLKNIELGTKTSVLVSQIAQIKTIIVNSEIEAFLLENSYIKKYKPKYNIKLTDDKAYLMIRITVKDKYPKVLTARRPDDKNSIYFGPFPNASFALRTVLRTIRKIFPYQSALNHAKRICLYYHLGLCPCPPVFDSPEFKTEYKKNIKHIVDFLNGNTKKIIKDLKREREILSKEEKFEKANSLQNKINAINLITGPFYKTQLDQNITPNLPEDLRTREITELKDILNSNRIHVKNLERIECFDISNISGTNATGSMAVFTNGQKDGSQYRKFKIRFLDTPNDFGMMNQVLSRRLNHKEWKMPSLIIVDGGKGQVSTTVKVLAKLNIKIPIIGLAKKEETIITSNLDEISLPKDSNALKLIMRIRDEAHRFAITYHKKLRSKSLFS
jgi:excinuclease ABC subunit C